MNELERIIEPDINNERRELLAKAMIAMKAFHGLRLALGSRQMIYDDGEWIVYYRPHRARKNKELYRGAYEREAVDALLEDVTE